MIKNIKVYVKHKIDLFIQWYHTTSRAPAKKIHYSASNIHKSHNYYSDKHFLRSEPVYEFIQF